MTRADGGLAFGIWSFFGGAVAPFIGICLTRFGPRPVFTAGFLASGVAYYLTSRAQDRWDVLLCFGLFAGLHACFLHRAADADPGGKLVLAPARDSTGVPAYGGGPADAADLQVQRWLAWPRRHLARRLGDYRRAVRGAGRPVLPLPSQHAGVDRPVAGWRPIAEGASGCFRSERGRDLGSMGCGGGGADAAVCVDGALRSWVRRSLGCPRSSRWSPP